MNFLRAFVFFTGVLCLLAETDPVHEKPTAETPKEELNDFDREHEEAGILSLTDDTFDDAIASHPAILVKFYAPWCIHSRELAPEYIKAALILKATNSTVRLARMDASLEKKTAEKYDVKGYPTLKYIKGDYVIDFSGGKTGQSIASWVETKLLPAAITLSTVEEAEKFVASQSATILGMFNPGEGADEKVRILEQTAFTRLDEIPCGVSTTEEVISHFKVSNDTILLFQNIDKERIPFHGPFDVDSIATFVKANKLPLVVEFTHDSAPDIFGGNVTTHALLFVRKSQEADFKAAYSQFHAPAKSFRGRVIFIYVNTDADENEKILQFFGVKKEDPPAVRLIALDMNMSKFKPTFDTVTSEALAEFVQDVLDGKVDPHLPSQELPEDWDSKPVKILVIKNFDQVTMDQNKTVFVMFYAPFCEHSKMLAPVWDQLADEYANNDTIVIAKMDSSANELPDMKIMSFPTLKLFPANSNDVLDYHGMDRSLPSLKAFLDRGGRKQAEVNDKGEPKEEEGRVEESTTEPPAKDDDASKEETSASSDKTKHEL